MNNINFAPNPGHVVIGIQRSMLRPNAGKIVVYAYYGNEPQRRLAEFPYDPSAGHVLFLVQQVANAAEAAGAWAVSYSSTVDFWEEAIA